MARGRPASVRVGVVIGLAAISISGWAPPVSAGGAETLDLGVRSVATGSSVVARSAFVGRIRHAVTDVPTPVDGPFYGYLLPAGPPWRSIEPPRIPRLAVPLGAIRIEQVEPSDGGWTHIATLRFVVPDVPTGVYGIHLCNDPCTASSVGDLYAGGVFGVGATEAEGGLAIRLWRQRFRLDHARASVRRLRGRVVDLEQDVAERRADGAMRWAEIEGLRRAVERLDGREEQAIAAGARSSDRAEAYRWLSIVLAVGLLASLIARRAHQAPEVGGYFPTARSVRAVPTEREVEPRRDRDLVGAGPGRKR